ncbi:choline/carnitine/betaine transporter [Gracilibacillus halophilus YIM-C55.5]|uniref:Choline/carnitine/betaine transporter n=1 Tax=Gracilibacillus halophilus YIM-C55.5 TaxID=1308866 RepID=N4WN28_9BACI|nr:BCCT family transporter [Gracilibacillus halophilus]ENH95915.1 choline/carnitine/betaine transporter [Gracilibacillus halophilus YIM-C55.5]
MFNKKNIVLQISVIISILFVIIGVVFNDWLGQKANSFLDFAVTYFNWFYLVIGAFFVVLCLYFMFSKYGNIRLGKDADQPAHSTLSWITMLFSAGMGVGLVFWGVTEPVMHYTTPPYGEGSTAEAASLAMKFTFFHWGLHPWALYALVALGLAYFQFRKKMPGTMSSIFYPLLGDKIYGPFGKTIDILAVFITAVGVASTFGLSTLQITSGLNSQWGVPNTLIVQLFVIGIATVLFIISSWSGLNRGIKYLSNFNMFLFFTVIFFVLFTGPTKQVLEVFISSTGSYLGDILPMSLRMEPYNSDANSWIGSWTVFYWAWWTTWAPFVGSFIARISKGRTIREFIIGVLFVPSLISFLWFSVLGGSAIHLIHDLGNTALGQTINDDVNTALFAFLHHIPLGSVISILSMILIFSYFVTSADSATFVLGMLSSEGNLNPSNQLKILWGIITAGSATVFLLAGGLDAVKTISIVVATPFTIVLLFICVATLKEMKKENK